MGGVGRLCVASPRVWTTIRPGAHGCDAVEAAGNNIGILTSSHGRTVHSTRRRGLNGTTERHWPSIGCTVFNLRPAHSLSETGRGGSHRGDNFCITTVDYTDGLNGLTAGRDFGTFSGVDGGRRRFDGDADRPLVDDTLRGHLGLAAPAGDLLAGEEPAHQRPIHSWMQASWVGDTHQMTLQGRQQATARAAPTPMRVSCPKRWQSG